MFISPAVHECDIYIYRQFCDVLKTLLDKHAPLAYKYISKQSPSPWMTSEMLLSKRRRRYLEHVWRKTRSSLDRSRYSKQCHLCNRQMAKAKSEYFTNMVSSNSENSHQLWSCINKILHRRAAPSLPKHNSLCSLCDLFSGYFKDKITRIQSSFPVHMLNKVEVQPPPISSLLSSFTPATAEEVRQIIMSSPNKFCDLDPMPTVLLKACIDTLLGTITNIVNMSLRTSIFPDDFKQAHVNPLLKKTTLSKDNLKNYRPVSNLSFISKILETVVAKRLGSHITSNNLSTVFQSAYKKLHSTETALLKVHNDITLNMDNGRVTALTLLDLSAAFDKINHSILMDRLSVWYGVSGRALSWFRSYLSGRHQRVKIGDCFSSPLNISCGVPQGSVLGPLLFTLYTTPLSLVINRYHLSHHLYADDTQF